MNKIKLFVKVWFSLINELQVKVQSRLEGALILTCMLFNRSSKYIFFQKDRLPESEYFPTWELSPVFFHRLLYFSILFLQYLRLGTLPYNGSNNLFCQYGYSALKKSDSKTCKPGPSEFVRRPLLDASDYLGRLKELSLGNVRFVLLFQSGYACAAGDKK